MEKFPFLRRPLKLILYGIMFALISAAALIFAWQYKLDGLALDYSLRNYAYIGTIYNESAAAPLLQPLPEELISAIEDSSYVDHSEIRQIRGVQLEDVSPVPEHMMTTQQLNQHYFIEAAIIRNQSPPQDDPIRYETYTASLQRQWGADTIRLASLTIFLTRLDTEPAFEPGQHIFLIGNYMIEHNAVRTNYMQIYSPGAVHALGLAYEEGSILLENGYTLIPEGLNALDTEAFVFQWMEEKGILPMYQRYTTLANNATAQGIQDMAMLSYMANGRFYIADGRQLYETDAGKNVCVISQGLSLRNRLSVGDTITLRISDSCYTASDKYRIAGYQSGFPMEDEAHFLNYGENCEYEVVGIFNQLSKDRNDPFFFTQNDIFIPVNGDSATTAAPYTFSFRVLGPNIDLFMEEFTPVLEENGYAFSIIDAGWEDVADSFYAMRDRRTMMLICAICAFLIAVTLLVVLLLQNFRYEYGVMRLLGAYKKEAFRTYIAGFLFCAIPATVLAAGSALAIYILWLRDAISNIIPILVPGNLECGLTLLGWAAAECIAAFGILTLSVALSERNRLLKLIH